MATPRDLAHAEQRTRILEVARGHLIRDGAAALSLRKVIAEVGMVSSAIYRYFPNRDALLTALIVEGYRDLATVSQGSPPLTRAAGSGSCAPGSSSGAAPTPRYSH